MQNAAPSDPAYVIKAYELAALNYLPPSHPRPQQLEWINRGTSRPLRRTTIDQMLRMLFRESSTPSIVRLKQEAGLRIVFRTEEDREAFGRAFVAARNVENARRHELVTMVFESRGEAEQAVRKLFEAGVPERSISLMWRASLFLDPGVTWGEGHSALNVAGTVAGSGIAGAMLGVAVLAMPGVGPAGAAGAIAASAISSVAALSSVIGATGGAIARMLTDKDVDDVSIAYYEQQVRRGSIFISVERQAIADRIEPVSRILETCGGRPVSNA